MSNETSSRRSTEDLQRILESLIGDRDHILSGELTSVIRQYESEHGITILEQDEYDNVNAYCEDNGQVPLSPDALFHFLSIYTQTDQPESPPDDPPPAMPHSASLPPTSFKQYQDQTPRPNRTHNRRLSDRIRSPSDASSSSEDEPLRPRNARHASAPPTKAFPGQTFAQSQAQSLPPLPPLPLGARRQKTLSDSSKHEPPSSARSRGTPAPPSAFGFGTSGGFARPSPASRRRRGSTSGQSASGADDAKSPDFPPQGFRSFSGSVKRSSSVTSISNIMIHSPPWGGQGRDGSAPASPMSPHGLDMTSYHDHERAKSPDASSEAGSLRGRDEDEEGEDGGNDEVADDVDGLPQSRLSRISTESSASLRTSHDKLRLLQKQNTDLARKLKESERQLASLGADNERLVEELQDKLEEARAEIAQRRKDEKEWKGKERAQMIQISGFEADISSLQRSLENAKSNHASMQKMYNSQCEEAQRLRDLLRTRDDEIHDLEATAQTHEADEDKSNREIQALESAVKRVETELASARQAESFLETQKQENLQLKETIDRMRYELDEARSAVANGGHTRQTTGPSVPGTLSRNLGDELTRRLADMEQVREEREEGDGGDGDGEGESFVETIVTTQRTRRVGSRPQQSGAGQTQPTPGQPIIRIEEGIREYTDASTETDPVRVLPLDEISTPSSTDGLAPIEGPPAYTRIPPPIDAKQVLEDAHPREMLVREGSDVSEGYEGYADVVDEVGVRCVVLEGEMKRREAERRKLGEETPRRRRGSRVSRSASYNVHYITQDWSYRVVVPSVALVFFVLGVSFGGKTGPSADDALLAFRAASSIGDRVIPTYGRALWGSLGGAAQVVAARTPI